MARRLSQAPGAFREVLPRVALALSLPLFAVVYSAGAAAETAQPLPRRSRSLGLPVATRLVTPTF
jgi:hypothetical protein